MIFDALVVGHVRANLWRALVSIAAIALGVASAFVLAHAGTQTLAGLAADRALFATHTDVRILPYGGEVSERVFAGVRYLDGVARAEPVIDQPFTFGVDRRSGNGGSDARLLGVDLLQPLPGVTGFEEGRPGPFAPVGSFIDPATVIGTNGAIVSSNLARRFHLRRGAHVAALAGAEIVDLTIANVLPPGASGVDSNTVFVDVTTAQRIYHDGTAFDRIDIDLADGASPALVRERIAAVLGDRARLAGNDDDATLGDISGGIDATFGALAAMALLLGGLLVFNAIGTSIAHRRGDIGTLRALGVAPHQIVAAFVGEGAAYGAIGAMFGIGLVILALHQEIDTWSAGGAIALGIAIAVASSIVPAVSASGMAPAIAARLGAFEGARTERPLVLAGAAVAALALGVSFGAHPAPDAAFLFGLPLCFALAGGLLIPVLLGALAPLLRRASDGAAPPVRFAALTLGAIPKRIGVGFGALAIAVYATVAFDISGTSFQAALDAWATHGIAGDLIVRPAGAAEFGKAGFDRGVLVRTEATPGVRSVAGLRTVQTTARGSDVALRGDDDFVPTPMPGFTDPPAQVSAVLARTLHVRRGDVLEVRAPHRTLRLRVALVPPDFAGGRGTITVARRLLRDAFGDDRLDALRVTVDPGADVSAVRTAIAHALAPRRVGIVTARELRDDVTGAFARTFGLASSLGAVVVAIAVAGVASALAALVFERAPELRMLRRLGASRRTIAAMLFLEAFAIAVLASTLGLALGLGLAAVQLWVADPVALGFPIPMEVPFARVALLVAAGIGAATLATVFSLPGAAGIATDRRRADAP